jgi:hypothetical protein
MSGRGLVAVLVGALMLSAQAQAAPKASCPAALSSAIPKRPATAITGSEFARRVGDLSGSAREEEIAAQLRAGNVPGFLRRLEPVHVSHAAPGRRPVEITLCVTRDYLSIGSDRDFMRIPMGLPTAIATARAMGFLLPTRRMVDAIYEQAQIRLGPEPMKPGPEMRSTAYYVSHNRRIAAQRAAIRAPLAALTAGHKKDLVLSNRLWGHPGRVAIYGWHRRDGTPIQPLSTVHGARYADYSHGVRLVSAVAYVDGRPRPLSSLIENPHFAAALSDEGPIVPLAELLRTLDGAAGPTADAAHLVEAAALLEAAARR